MATNQDKGTPIGVTDLNNVMDKGTPIGVKQNTSEDEESTKEDSDDAKDSE